MTTRESVVRRCLALGGAIALTLTATACTPDAGVTASPTKVAQSTSLTPPPTTSPTTTVPTTSAPPLTPEPTTAGPTPVAPKPTPTAKPVPAPVIILEQGDVGSKVRAFQARLRQIGWFSGDVSDRYGTKTAAAVRGFQAKRGYPVTGRADERTYDKLIAMTRRPTADELANVKPKPVEPKPSSVSWDVDKRCLTGRVMCISKSTRRLTWVVDGVPQYGFDVRFGSDELPTREGVFSVYLKKVDVISNLYHTPMPYSMFFSGGQAVHYSSNFARLGYSGASHGCVNVRNKPLLIQLYNEVRIGDKVVVHW
ncbi:MAG TPA: L,D-transpeptidase family protein [Humibacillus sp.]|nr:L,D-transpeptidase family protein [Humibacillus sp.]